ncbi:MAG: class I SAM-dependent methyltransferase [Planctomycetes bacterium]|nr:class I SAM-dependent methyltransferase [Planctomycetota bacterium]
MTDMTGSRLCGGSTDGSGGHAALVRTFDAWAAEGRDASMERGHGDVVAQVVAKLGIKPGEQILDLGCGNGWATRLLAKAAPGAGAIGVDASPKMVERAESLHSYTIRARYEVAHFEKLPFNDKKFDRAFSMEALYYAVDLDAALAELARVLKPGAPADVVVDFHGENEASRVWADWGKSSGLAMHFLGRDEWGRRFERAGFGSLAFERLIDSRGPGDPQKFRADVCEPDWETRCKIHAAGSLWIHGVKAQ